MDCRQNFYPTKILDENVQSKTAFFKATDISKSENVGKFFHKLSVSLIIIC